MSDNTKDRQLLDAFARFQWDNLPVELQLKLVGTVFNQKTINDFLSSLPEQQQQKGECQHRLQSIARTGSQCIDCGKLFDINI